MKKNYIFLAYLVISLVSIGAIRYQLYQSENTISDQSEQIRTMSSEIVSLTTENKRLTADIRDREKDIQEIMDEYYTYRTRDMSTIRELTKKAASLGWTARGRKGMTLDDLYDLLDRK